MTAVTTALKIAVGIAIVFGAYWLWYADERENNKNINPDIFPAFRAIEAQCQVEEFPHETVRCQKALKLLERCIGEDSRCDAQEYYEKLYLAGFELPSLYIAGYKKK